MPCSPAQATTTLNTAVESATIRSTTTRLSTENMTVTRLSLLLSISLTTACSSAKDDDATRDTGSAPCADGSGCVLADELPFGLLSVQIPQSDDVWIVGSSPEPADGTGPAVLHYDGSTWERIDTSAWAGTEIWWSWVTDDEAVFVGNEGLIVEMSRADGTLTRVDGPTADVTFFGVWGASPDDVWAVGMTQGGEGPRAVWRRQGGTWSAWTDPVLGEGDDNVTYFKVHGTRADDVWMVGTQGRTLHWDGTSLEAVASDADTPTSTSLFLTIDADPDHPVVVGGTGNGLILEYDGSAWRDRSPDFQPGFNGVCSGAGQQWAVGQKGVRARRTDDGTWTSDMDMGLGPLTYDDWHGCEVSPSGDLWAVGGRIASRPLQSGIIGFQGSVAPPPLPTAW